MEVTTDNKTREHLLTQKNLTEALFKITEEYLVLMKRNELLREKIYMLMGGSNEPK